MEVAKIANLRLKACVPSQKPLPYTELDFCQVEMFLEELFGRWLSLEVLVCACTRSIKLLRLFIVDLSTRK